jgi:predicted acyltransferase
MPPAPFAARNPAIDILRAITMTVMIFVNDFWTVSGIPQWMQHAPRNDNYMGLADAVFPCFLFVVGMSIPYAIENRYAKKLGAESTLAHILARTLALLVMGIFIVNAESGLSPALPYPRWGYNLMMTTAFVLVWNNYRAAIPPRIQTALKAAGILLLLFLAVSFRNSRGGVMTAGWWGILGLIGWAYLPCAILYLLARNRLRYLVPAWIALVAASTLLTPMKEQWGGHPLLNIPRPNILADMMSIIRLDNGTLAAFTLGGMIFSVTLARYRNATPVRKASLAAGAAAILAAAGFAASKLWIVSKIIATPPWLFYVSGIAVALYALISLAAAARRERWFAAIAPAGSATLTAYLVPYILYAISSLAGLKTPGWASHGPAAIAKCAVFALFAIQITRLLGKAGLKLKI